METPPLIDTHAHLDASDYDEDRTEVVRRAAAAGVNTVITVGIEPNGWVNTLRLAEMHSGVYPALGVHPNSANLVSDEVLATLFDLCRQASNSKPVVALGETGLDYYWDTVSPAVQQHAFRAHLEMARELDLPVIVHNRDAHADVLSILETEGKGTRGVMHSASGDLDFVRRCLALGYMISVAGPVTFKKAADKHAIARETPLSMLLLETDCPYLTPEPFRGKRNEPAYVRYTAQAVASLRGIDFTQVADATTQNAYRLFNLASTNTLHMYDALNTPRTKMPAGDGKGVPV